MLHDRKHLQAIMPVSCHRGATGCSRVRSRGVKADRHDDRYRACRLLGREPGAGRHGGDQLYLEFDEFGRHPGRRSKFSSAQRYSMLRFRPPS